MSDEMQKKYIEFQVMQQQMQQMQQQLQQIDSQKEELDNVVASLEEFKGSKPGSKMLVPIASGIFVEAELKNAEKVRVNVGSSVSVKKTVDETIDLVKKQGVEMAKVKDQLTENLTTMMTKGAELEKELQGMVAETEKEEHKCSDC